MQTQKCSTTTGDRRPYNSGDVARKIYGTLLRDFKTCSTAARLDDEQLLSSTLGIKAFRDRSEREMGFVPVDRFKKVKQLEALLKKFRFSTDAYTDDELSAKSANAFLEEQLRLHKPMPLKLSGIKVLQRARLIAGRILGDYPGDEVIENVRFGKKSSIGCPLSLAYIDEKLSRQRAFTGTREATSVFLNQVLPGDHILQRILAKHNFAKLKEQLSLTYLNLVEVPKTWKVFRLITPLSLLGLFFSYGIGRVVTRRLKDAGLDIGTLQFRHRKLVKQFSMTRSHATADLSAASDSITSELLNRILPRPWYVAVKKTFVRNLNISGNVYSTVSVLPMGNGATFPLETLVFYCIIKAIGELTETKGIYSVYGDDLIYPSRLHKYVVGVFPQLHLKLNLDKTFVRYPFRESCGSDYYRGQDVRPHFIKGEAEQLTRVRYEAFLYKVYNGLTARWDPREIRGTLTWILSELAMVSNGRILRVPPSFPDYSGLKVSSCSEQPLDYNLLPWSPIFVQFRNGSRWFQFDFLTETPKKRVVKSTEPYYWLALQGLTDDVVDEYGALTADQQTNAHRAMLAGFEENGVWRILRDDPYWAALARAPYSPLNKPNVALNWKKVVKKKTLYFNQRKVVKKRTNYIAVVSSRKGGTVSTATTRTDTVSDWI
jgi:hypothetical protein